MRLLFMAKKRVCFYLKKIRVGGLEGSLFEYLKKIDKALYDVTLLVGIKTYPLSPYLREAVPGVMLRYVIDCGDVVDKLSTSNKYWYKWGLKLKYNLIFRFLGKFYLKFILPKILNDYDCVVDYSLNLDYLIRRVKIPTVGFFHFRINQHYKSNKVERRLRCVLGYYHKIVTINQQMLLDAKSIFPQYQDKFVMLYNQFNFAKIIDLAEEDIDDDYLNVDYVVSVGRLFEDQKDFTSLIHAFKILKEKYNHPEKLLIVGDGADRSKLSILAKQLNLQDVVCFVGYQANPYKFIKRAKLFAFSSKYEGLANVLIEAMILGVPVVSTNCPDGPAEVLMNGECGILVEVGNYIALADAMRQLLLDRSYAKKIVNNANIHMDRFNIDVNIAKLYELF